jgi:DNA-directed RNA polymerase sigma subunit (sigma70/sigma32)
MAKRDPHRTERLRRAIRYMLDHGTLVQGSQSRLAEHFKVTRQRVHQIVVEERRRLVRKAETEQTTAEPAQPSSRAS